MRNRLMCGKCVGNVREILPITCDQALTFVLTGTFIDSIHPLGMSVSPKDRQI